MSDLLDINPVRAQHAMVCLKSLILKASELLPMDIRKHKDKPQRLRVITGEISNRSNVAKEDDGEDKKDKDDGDAIVNG